MIYACPATWHQGHKTLRRMVSMECKVYKNVKKVKINDIEYAVSNIERVIRDFKGKGQTENRLFIHLDKDERKTKELGSIAICTIWFESEPDDSRYERLKGASASEMLCFKKVDDDTPLSQIIQ
jgi:hypothetical protein